jgi:hypothetical protein
MRDITLADTIYMSFTTRAFATGIPTTLAGTPVISAYEDAGLTQITAGITLGVDHDGVTGLNMITIVATGANGFEDNKDYSLVITTGTVGGVSVVGEIVGQFSIQRSPVNWANVSNPTTAVDLSSTDIQLVDTTTTNTDMVTEPPTAAAIVNEWETQSQADPTGFHVNVLEVGGTAQTANDNGADINTLLTRIVGTLAAGTHNPATAAQIAVLSDWIDGGRLDLILDIIAVDTTTDIPALIAALNDISSANVLTQVNAALDTAIAELGVAAPTATPTLRTGLMLLYMMTRNRVDVDTTGTDAIKIYNNAGTQIASKLVTDDGTDYSEAEMS